MYVTLKYTDKHFRETHPACPAHLLFLPRA